MKIKLIFIYFLSVFLSVSMTYEYDCVTFKNTPGVCKPDKECKYFLQIFRKRKFSEIQRMVETKCSNELNHLILCCPIEDEIITTSTKATARSLTSKSNQACKNFGKRPPFIPLTVKIINGTEAKPNEFPQFAALGYMIEDKITFLCGGSLISELYVLTAAHCCREKLSMVRLGKHKLQDYENDDYEGFDYDIEEVLKHPSHTKRLKYNDIALLKLTTEVYLGYAIWPACLPQQNEFLEFPLLIAGFGRTSVTNDLKIEIMMKSTVEEIPLEECKYNYSSTQVNLKKYNLDYGITNDLLCAKNRDFHTDTCQGDSGTGLFYVTNDILTVVGVTSFGLSCNTSLPSFYTRVASYREWIENIVWPFL